MLKRLVPAWLLFGLIIRIVLSWQPVEGLIWRTIADDAFYYLKLAQNLANGAGPTTDGINLTNGFHPVYTLLLVPIVGLAGKDLDLAVHLALTLITFLNVATAWPIYLLGLRLRSPRAGVIGAVLYALNPWSVLLTMTGVESALYVFLCAWAILAYVRWRDAPECRPAILAGLICGVTIMARSEGLLLLAGIAIDTLRRRRTLQRRHVVQVGMLVGAAIAVCLPWAVWSTALFGTPFQTSSAAIRLHTWAPAPGDATLLMGWYASRLAWFSTRYVAKLALFTLPVVLSLVIAGGLLVLSGQVSRFSGAFRAAGPLFFLTIPLSLLAVYYNMYLLHQQNWYFNASVLMLTLLGMLVLDACLDALALFRLSGRLLQWSGAVVAAMFVAVLAFMWERGLYPSPSYGQLDAYHLGRWIQANGLQSATFAATDSGIVGYFCDCRMVNLDGVMNFSAYRYYEANGYSQGSIAAYISTQPIEYIFGRGESGSEQSIVAGGRTFKWVQRVNATGMSVYRAVE